MSVDRSPVGDGVVPGEVPPEGVVFVVAVLASVDVVPLPVVVVVVVVVVDAVVDGAKRG